MEKSIVIASNNKNILGVMHYPESQTQERLPVIIMSHGFAGDKIGPYPYLFVLTARILAKQGYAVLRFDYTGSGDSEGIFEEQNLLTQQIDLRAVIQHIAEDPQIDRDKIYLLGHSRGGAVSIMLASEDPRIKGIITWATPATWDDIWKGSEDTFKTTGYIEFSSLRETQELYEIDIKHQPKNYAQKVSLPWLIIHGGQDGQIEGSVHPSHAEELYNQAPDQRTLKIIESANHFFYSGEERETLWKTTLNWLKNHS